MRQSKNDKWKSIKYVNITIYKVSSSEIKNNESLSSEFPNKQTKTLEFKDINQTEIKPNSFKETINKTNENKTQSPVKINVEIKINSLTETEKCIRNLAERDAEINFKCEGELDSDTLKYSLENSSFHTSEDFLNSSGFQTPVNSEKELILDLQKRGILIDSSLEIQKAVNSFLNKTLKERNKTKVNELKERNKTKVNEDSLEITDTSVFDLSTQDFSENNKITKNSEEIHEAIKNPEIKKNSADTHEILEYFPLNNKKVNKQKEDLRNNKKFSSALLIAKNNSDNFQLVSHLHKISQKTLIKKDEIRNVVIKKNVFVEEYSKTDSGDCYDCEEADRYFEEGE